jgi:hypothetical protein
MEALKRHRSTTGNDNIRNAVARVHVTTRLPTVRTIWKSFPGCYAFPFKPRRISFRSLSTFPHLLQLNPHSFSELIRNLNH